jgi:hypothetical protein
MLGKHELNVYEEIGSKNSSVKSLIIHPKWQSFGETHDGDIAVVVLNNSIDFNEFIQPICIPEQSFEYFDETGRFAGWGQSRRDHRHDTKPNEIEIPVVNLSYCFSVSPNLAMIASIDSFCGGYKNQGKAPCMIFYQTFIKYVLKSLCFLVFTCLRYR